VDEAEAAVVGEVAALEVFAAREVADGVRRGGCVPRPRLRLLRADGAHR
jgi:hypothetical protein